MEENMHRKRENKQMGKAAGNENQISETEETLIAFYRLCHPQTQKAILDFVIRTALEEGR